MTRQVAVKLPDELVERVDELVSRGVFRSRSAAIRHGLESVLTAERRQAIDRAYDEGYRSIPETAEEMLDATRLATEAIREEPWEKWW